MSPRASRRRIAGVAAGVVLTASLAWAAVGLAAPEVLVPRGEGLTAPTGVVETPDGAHWVADALLGVCRLQPGGSVAEDVYCSDAHVAPHAGPINATGLVFDPATSSFYSGDQQSGHGAIWRLHWDPQTGTIDGARELVDLGEDRVTALGSQPATATAPAAVFYATKRSAAIRRLELAPAGAGAPSTVGVATQEGAGAIAVLDGHVYLAGSTAVTRLPLSGGTARTAAPVAGMDGIAPSALVVDRANHRLYAGTTVPELTDDLVVLDTVSGAVETYETAFSGITGLGVGIAGDVLVADDPGTAAGGIDSAHQGRLYRVPFKPLGLSRTTIVAAPDGWSAAGSVTFAYAATGEHGFECRLDGGAWTPCPGRGEGSVSFDDLPEGPHSFEVRATEAAGSGKAARRVFVLDRTAPTVTVTEPAPLAEAGTARVLATADEAPVEFSCAFDGGEPQPCEPGEALPAGLAPGDHVLRVTARDSAGNRSDPAARTANRAFTVVIRPSTPAPPAGRGPDGGPPPVAVPARALTPAPGPAQAAPSAARPPVVAPALRLLRLHPEPGRIRGAQRAVTLSFNASDGARTAQLRIVTASTGAVRVHRVAPVTPGARNRLRFVLRDGERLRPGLYRVFVTLATGDGIGSNRGERLLRVRG